MLKVDVEIGIGERCRFYRTDVIPRLTLAVPRSSPLLTYNNYSRVTAAVEVNKYNLHSTESTFLYNIKSIYLVKKNQ